MRELRACQLYHCLPSQLGGEETYKLERHRAILAAEADYLRKDRISDEDAAKRKGK